MKALLFGCNGQIGWELHRALLPSFEILALSRGGSSGFKGDLFDLLSLTQTIQTFRPDIIFNAAAYTNVDKAETEPELAFFLNETAPAHIANEAKKIGAFLVHYSTDYVFDGKKNRPWQEEDRPEPLNIYGLSKRAGEIAIQETGCNGLIIRTSWIYSTRRRNFVKTILEIAKNEDKIDVVADQTGVPTSAEFIADASIHMSLELLKKLPNDFRKIQIYHLSASGETTWYQYAKLILERAGELGYNLRASKESIYPISSLETKRLAKRPTYSTLSNKKVINDFQLNIPLWSSGVLRTLAELKETCDG